MFVTYGPYTKTVGRRLSGSFIVERDDCDALVDVARVLTQAHPLVVQKVIRKFGRTAVGCSPVGRARRARTLGCVRVSPGGKTSTST